MTIVVNGTPRELDGATRLGALVDEVVADRRGVATVPDGDVVADRRGVAVAVDGEVVPRADWDATPLHDGARVEVVGAVQGG